MNVFPPSVKQGVIALLEKKCKAKIVRHQFDLFGGGCINHGGKLETSAGNFFVKWNDAGKFPGMFSLEAHGLDLLRAAKAIHIPEVIGHDEIDSYQFIVLELIEQHKRSGIFWETMGHKLATLHKHTNENFGLSHSNYIGSLRQFNTQNTSWADFFIEQRLHVQLKFAVDLKLIETSLINKFESLYKKIPSILSSEVPSLLHGDLWNGNLLINERGSPCLIDPAVYYGHREVDLAMTQLFGGFSDEFYDSYREAFPLEPGYEKRFSIYNLHPLLVHVNLFGQSYLAQIKAILRSI